MHSSRVAFSSLQTQQGWKAIRVSILESLAGLTALGTFTFAAASPGGFRDVDVLVAVDGAGGVEGC